MRTGLVISGGVHAAVLLWCVVTFVVRPNDAKTIEAVPIDVVSNSDIAKMANGVATAPPSEKPKPVAEKVGPPAPADDPLAKLANKEIKAATDTPPPPERKPAEAKAKKPPPPADPIADALKKDEEKKPEPKKAEVKPPQPQPKKPESPAFDPRQVADLLNKRTPQRVAAADTETNSKLSFGGSGGMASQTSQNELGAMQARLQQLWNPPAGAKDPQELTVEVEIQLKPDGTLAAPPSVRTRGNSPLFMAAKDSAIRAVYQGQPYTMLRPEHYEDWKEVSIVFDPRFMSSY